MEVVHKWCQGFRERGQGFCDISTKVLVIKSVTMGEWGQKLSEIAWRHLWTTIINKNYWIYFFQIYTRKTSSRWRTSSPNWNRSWRKPRMKFLISATSNKIWRNSGVNLTHSAKIILEQLKTWIGTKTWSRFVVKNHCYRVIHSCDIKNFKLKNFKKIENIH